MSFCRACFRMFPYICKEQMTSVTTILDYTTNKNFTKMKKKWICSSAACIEDRIQELHHLRVHNRILCKSIFFSSL